MRPTAYLTCRLTKSYGHTRTYEGTRKERSKQEGEENPGIGVSYREVNTKVATAPKLKVEDKDRVNNSRRIKTVKLHIVKPKASLNKFSRGKLVIKVECEMLKLR